jgi:hypothetical protein
MNPTRRDFIKFVVAGAVTSGCPFIRLLAQSAEKRDRGQRRAHHLPSVRDLIADLPRVSALDLVITGGISVDRRVSFLNLDWLLLERNLILGQRS